MHRRVSSSDEGGERRHHGEVRGARGGGGITQCKWVEGCIVAAHEGNSTSPAGMINTVGEEGTHGAEQAY